jgi:hypothetical protein
MNVQVKQSFVQVIQTRVQVKQSSNQVNLKRVQVNPKREQVNPKREQVDLMREQVNLMHIQVVQVLVQAMHSNVWFVFACDCTAFVTCFLSATRLHFQITSFQFTGDSSSVILRSSSFFSYFYSA